VILVTPDPERVGPCLVVIPEAVSLPESVVRRLSLLEEAAEVARLVLERPGDTDAAGWLAELLAAAGYPVREEALT
jgi:hypothetical protein